MVHRTKLWWSDLSDFPWANHLLSPRKHGQGFNLWPSCTWLTRLLMRDAYPYLRLTTWDCHLGHRPVLRISLTSTSEKFISTSDFTNPPHPKISWSLITTPRTHKNARIPKVFIKSMSIFDPGRCVEWVWGRMYFFLLKWSGISANYQKQIQMQNLYFVLNRKRFKRTVCTMDRNYHKGHST